MEGEIRMQAQMYAIVAEMEAVKAEIEGMKAYNAYREGLGQGIRYNDNQFFETSDRLNALAKRLRDGI